MKFVDVRPRYLTATSASPTIRSRAECAIWLAVPIPCRAHLMFGATGIQVIQTIAGKVGHLKVFSQRSPLNRIIRI
jgi:hypothetical protein